MSDGERIENRTTNTKDELEQLRRELLWKFIDEKEKDDFTLRFWKETTIDYLLDEWKWWFKLRKFFRGMFLKIFSKSYTELENFSKEIKQCDTQTELNNLRESILNNNRTETAPGRKQTRPAQTSNNNWERNRDRNRELNRWKENNGEHYEIDHFNIHISEKYRELYNNLRWLEKPDLEPFACAVKWYEELKWTLKNKKYLTVVDYTKPRSENRFYVINMETYKVEHATRVWHWHNSWEGEWATSFSNVNGSEKSSLWFLTTSLRRESNSNPNYRRQWLRMYWTESSNNNAASRWIFMHRGQKNGSLYSQWCFVIPDDITETILNKVIWWSLLFSYAKSTNYFANSNHFITEPNWDVSIC